MIYILHSKCCKIISYPDLLQTMPRKEPSPVFNPSHAKSLLRRAKQYHPEELCVKPVYGAMELKTPQGKIDAYARNGMPRSTPAHLDQFQASNLLALAQTIDGPERDPLVRALEAMPPDEIISCNALAQASGEPLCLKGFNWDDPSQRSLRESPPYCPNHRAACTERILLRWKPYLVQLQNQVQPIGEVLHVKNVVFQPNTTVASVEFRVNSSNKWYTIEVDSMPLTNSDLLRTSIYTGAIPCIPCVEQIVQPPPIGADDVFIDQMTRYRDQSGRALIDGDDIAALNAMGKQSNVGIIFSTDKGNHIARLRP